MRYNLSLPSEINEIPLTWSVDKPEIITNKGVVNSQAEITDVKLTVTAMSGALDATKDFNLKVIPIDKSKLTEAVRNANEEIANLYRSDSSKAQLRKLVDKANTVTSQTDADKLVSDIVRVIAKKDYSMLYMNPFMEVADDFNPAISEMITLKPAETKTVKKNELPANVKGAVNVSYESLATDVATVDKNGMITAKNVGYAMIVTKVSAKYDNFTLEYYTLVRVDVDLSGVRAKAKATSLAKGKTTKIVVTIPNEIKGSTKTYHAVGAVSVDKDGKITAKSAGTGKVYVKISAAGKSITKTVTIKVGEITGPSSLKVKKSATLKVKGLSGTVKWSLDKKGKKLATISKKGKLIAKKTGKVKVTAKIGEVKMTKTIEIKKK